MEKEIATPSANITILSKKSWVAYLGTVLLGLVASLIAIPLLFTVSKPLVVAGVYLLVMAFVIYKFLLIKSYLLFYDDTSVWLFSGILPWNKGAYGVKWRDISEAVFYTKFSSWVFNSYAIRIGHRFTNGSELLANNMRSGKEAVGIINSRLADLARAGKLN